MEEKLLKSEKKYHFLFNAINDAVFIIDTETLDILETNQSAVEMYGYSYEEFKSFKITDLSIEPEITSEMIALHKKSVPFRYSKKKDGTYFPIEIKANYLTFHGKTLNISLVRDFTDHINTEQTLRVNEENLEMAQEVADIGSWDWNIKNDKLFWSDKTFCQFGLKPGEILPTYQAFTNFIHPDDRELVNQAVEKTLKDITPYSVDARMVRKDGTEWIMHAQGKVYKDKNNKPIRFVGTQHNITDRIHAETLLKKSEEKYRSLYNNVPIGLFRSTPQGKLVSVNQELVQMLGYKTASELMKIPTMEIYADPERRKDLFAHLHEKGTVKNFEMIAKHQNGNNIWISTSIQAQFDHNGNIIFLDGIGENITKHKLAENALHESEKKYRTLVNTSPFGIQLTDCDGKIIFSNPAHHQIQGYNDNKLVGKYIWDLIAKEKDKEKTKEYYRHIIKNQPSPEPYFSKDMKIDGCIIKTQINWEYVRNSESDIEGIISIITDVTEKLKAEKALKEEMQLRNTLIEALPYPTMLIKKDKTVIFANKVARDVGARVGGICWQDFGHSDYIPEKDKEYINQHKTTKDLSTHCTFCLADEALSDLKPIIAPEVEAFGKIFETYWVPVSNDMYLHYSLDITEKKQTEKQLVSSLDEKVVLLREIHHRVKNNMQVIISLLRMHGRRTNDANLGKIFEDCRDRINAMSLIHESLYQSDNLARIDFKVYLKKLCRNLKQAYGAVGKGISLTVGECSVALDMDQGIAIGMVIAELISNAFKHAFHTGKGGNVSINLSELDAENVKLIVKDDGKGMPPEIDLMNVSSLGLRLVVGAVTLELGGSIEVERDKGTQFTICFKYKKR